MPIIIPYEPGRDSSSTVFKTHLNYVKCMERLSYAMCININIATTGSLDSAPILKFEKLARITKTSIMGEKTACDNEKAYAQIAAPWIPVKCYYRLYYLESVLMYVLNGSLVGFGNGGHKGVRKGVLQALEARQIAVSPSSSELGTNVDWSTADAFRAANGSTIRANYYTTDDCPQSLRKKISEYIELDWKQSSKVSNYRRAADRTKKSLELLPKKFDLLDYFYWMRIKANYRDIDFLDFDNQINQSDAYEYLTVFIRATEHYANALEAAISLIKANRGMPTT
jgi:hypothetical protein